MSLDKKQGQNKLFAFEINNIMKAIRNLAQNIISLNRSAHWEYISSASFNYSATSGTTGSTSVDVPADAQFAVIKMTVTMSGYTAQGDLIIAKIGKTSGVHRGNGLTTNSDYWFRGTASWSGNIISLAYRGGSTAGTSQRGISGAVYFYK